MFCIRLGEYFHLMLPVLLLYLFSAQWYNEVFKITQQQKTIYNT